jgi:hypothetical protein
MNNLLETFVDLKNNTPASRAMSQKIQYSPFFEKKVFKHFLLRFLCFLFPIGNFPNFIAHLFPMPPFSVRDKIQFRVLSAKKNRRQMM